MSRKTAKGAAQSAPILNPGEVIRQHRLAKGWTQAELGERLGASKARVSNLERWGEDARPTLGWFVEKAAVWIELGIPVKELLGGYFTPASREWIREV